MSIISLFRIIKFSKEDLVKGKSNDYKKGFEDCERIIQIHIDRNSESFNKDLKIDELLKEKIELESEIKSLKRLDQKRQQDFSKKEYRKNLLDNLGAILYKGSAPEVKIEKLCKMVENERQSLNESIYNG